MDEIHSDDYRGVVNQSCSKSSVNVGGRVDKFFHEVMQVAILTGSVLYLSTVLISYSTQPVLILMMDMMNFWSMCLAPTAWSPDDHVVLSFA